MLNKIGYMIGLMLRRVRKKVKLVVEKDKTNLLLCIIIVLLLMQTAPMYGIDIKALIK